MIGNRHEWIIPGIVVELQQEIQGLVASESIVHPKTIIGCIGKKDEARKLVRKRAQCCDMYTGNQGWDLEGVRGRKFKPLKAPLPEAPPRV